LRIQRIHIFKNHVWSRDLARFTFEKLNRRKFVGLTKVQATGNVKHRIDFGLDLDASKPLFATVFINHTLLALSLRFFSIKGVFSFYERMIFKSLCKPLSRPFKIPPQHNQGLESLSSDHYGLAITI